METVTHSVDLVDHVGGEIITKLRKVLLAAVEIVEPAWNVEGKEILHGIGRDALRLETLNVDGALRGEEADGRGDGDGRGCKRFIGTLKDPLEDTCVFTKTGPHVATVLVLAEPVDLEDTREIVDIFDAVADVEPVLKVLAHVVAAEGEHRKGIMTELSDLSLGSSGGLRGDAGAKEGALSPVEGLDDKRDGAGTTTSKEDGRDGNTFDVLPVGIKSGALVGGNGKARVGMSSRSV